jgi:ankyrin repeat protein
MLPVDAGNFKDPSRNPETISRTSSPFVGEFFNPLEGGSLDSTKVSLKATASTIKVACDTIRKKPLTFKEELLIEEALLLKDFDRVLEILNSDKMLDQALKEKIATTAADVGRFDLIFQLMDHDLAFSEGVTSFLFKEAAKFGSLEMITALLSNDSLSPDSLRTGFDIAIECGHLAIVEKLFDSSRISVETKNSAVIKATQNQQKEILEFLLSKLDVDESMRGLAVVIATNFKNLELVHLLLANGSIAERDRSMAFQGAVENSQLELIQVLVDSGPINAFAKQTAFLNAVEFSSFETVSLMLRLSVVDQLTKGKALIDAAKKRNFSCVELLLKNGPIFDRELVQAFLICIPQNHKEIIQVFLENCSFGHLTLESAFLKAIEYDLSEIACLVLPLKPTTYEDLRIIREELNQLITKVSDYGHYAMKTRMIQLILDKVKEPDAFIECFIKIRRLTGWTAQQKTTLMISLFLLMQSELPGKEELFRLLKKHYKTLKDTRNIQALLQFQLVLMSSSLPIADAETLFKGLLKMESSKNMCLSLGVATAILKTQPLMLKDLHLEDVTNENLVEKITRYFQEKGFIPIEGCEPFLRSRNPKALFEFCSKQPSERLKSLILKFTTAVVKERFQIERNTLNSHLRYLEPSQKSAWDLSLTKREVCLSPPAESFNLKKFLEDKIVTDRHLEGLIRDGLFEIDPKECLDLNLIERKLLDLKEVEDKDLLESFIELKDLLKDLDCEFKNDLQSVIEQLTIKARRHKTYDLIDSDDPFDIFLSGTDVLGSCMRIDGDPKLNQALMGYLLDGKIRILVIKDPDTEMLVARAFIKLLLDDSNHPQLFFERVYGDIRFESDLVALAKKKAEVLGVKLYKAGSKGVNLHSKDNPAKVEYEDATGGMTSGSYILKGVEVT